MAEEIWKPDAPEREARLLALRHEAEHKGRVEDAGIRPAGAPFPVASPQTGYYQQHLLKKPQWTQLIPAYFFVGGATGALGVIGSLADLLGGDPKLALKARWLAVGGSALSGVLLITDLGRPMRFLYMLRIFKPQSVMSVGSWVLSAFGASAGLSSFADLLRLWYGSPWPIQLLSASGRIGSTLFGLPFHNYTGVLIGATVVPIWNRSVNTLPGQFGMSGLQSAVSLLELAGHSESVPLNVLGIASAALETRDSLRVMRSKDRVFEPSKRGLSGSLLRAAALLSGPVPIALRLAACFAGKRSKQLRRAAACCGIAGSFCMRYGWVEAGKKSTEDWRLPLEVHPQ